MYMYMLHLDPDPKVTQINESKNCRGLIQKRAHTIDDFMKGNSHLHYVIYRKRFRSLSVVQLWFLEASYGLDLANDRSLIRLPAVKIIGLISVNPIRFRFAWAE